MRIGVLVNNIDGRYQTQILRGIWEVCARFEAQAVIFGGRSFESPYADDALHNQVYAGALDVSLDGILVVAGAIGTNADDGQLARHLEPFLRRPLVTIGRRVAGIPGVISSDAQGVAEALDHLIDHHGCRTVAFLSGPPHDPASQVRLASYRDGLANHGLPYRSDLVYWGDYSFQCCPAVAGQMIGPGGLAFDALVCANDEMAIGVQQQLALAGFRCPQDYALVGFDDLPAFSLRTPGLTTVRQPLYEQTLAAGHHLVRQIRREESGELDDLASVFVRRETCGCSPIPVVGGRKARVTVSVGAGVGDPAAFLDEFFRNAHVDPVTRRDIEALVPPLLGVLVLDLRSQRESPLFLEGFNEWLEMTFGWERYAETWGALVSHLEAALVTEGLGARDLAYRATLIQSAQLLLARRSDQKEARKMAEASDQAAQFRWLSRQLAQTKRTSEVLPLLQASLGALGLTGVGWASEGPTVPGGEVVYLPLVVQGRSFGTLVATGRGVEPVVYATVQEEVAQALFQCSLFEEHARSEERYRDMAQMVPLLMWETDSRLVVTYRNRAAEESLNLAVGDGLRPRLVAADRANVDVILGRLGEVSDFGRPGIRVVAPGARGPVPVIQLTAIRAPGTGAVGLRWHALDPVPIALEATLPDHRFLEDHQVSGRERDVLVLVLYGLRSREIAGRLGIAESTVKGHLSHLFDKFGVENRASLVDRIHGHQVGRHGEDNYLLMVLNRLLAFDND